LKILFSICDSVTKSYLRRIANRIIKCHLCQVVEGICQ
jgi:hypothetical protein